MQRWSIGIRLTFWYSLMLLAGMLLFGAGLWWVVSHSLRSSVDHTVEAQAKAVITVLQTESDPAHPDQLLEELSEYVEWAPEGNLIEVRDGQDKALVSSRIVALARAAGQKGYGVETTSVGRFRTYVATTTAKGTSYRILVATPLDGTETTLRDASKLVLWSAPIVLLIASIGGYWISRRALAPVDDITRAARSIGIENLSQRLAVPASGDELARLSQTWNSMLARLESAVQRLSQFTADASHELRTPIALIRTTAELTLRRERSTETYREALRQIVAESERMSHLVDDLLLLARADVGLPALALERVELTPLVREVCKQGEVLARPRQLEISTEAPDGPVFVQANDPELRRLLLLLVDNAVKYTPPGGHITISVGSDADGATVAVRDTGIGIPETALPHVFERFYRAEQSRNRDEGGTGLGLSIAKWIADRHHASLEAESESGKGATFRVRFPS